jgi:hypothetical protein
MNEEQQREHEMWKAERAAHEEERRRERLGYPHQFKVGDGATERIGSDGHAYTVVHVTASGKQISMQRDKATLSPDFKPDFHPGGFVGNVSNQYEQSYTYERDPDGLILTARLTKRGWSASGTPVIKGRHEFCDYNF